MLCLKCNSPNHLANSPDCPLKDQPAHGLSKEVSEECSRLIKECKLSDRAHIADDAEHHIIVNRAIVAKYCRHCGRFVKGKNAHYTKGHKGKNRYAYKPLNSAPAPAPGPAPNAGSANLMTFPAGMDPNSVPVVDSLPSSNGVRWSDQVPVPAGYAPVQFNQMDYDLHGGPSFNLGQVEDDDSNSWSILSMLGLNM